MNTVLLLMKLAFLAASTAGWCLWAAHRFGLKIEQTPLAVISSLGCAMSAAALLNIIAPVRLALQLAGLGLLVWVLVRRRAALTPWLCARGAVYPVLCGVLLLLSRGGTISSHDNFSHWAIMAKTLVTGGQLPNTANTAVQFVGYPPATACWIDYVCSTVGLSDGMMLFAQGLVVLAGAWAVAGLCPKGRPSGWLTAAAALLVLLAGNPVPLSDLRVDGLLATQAAGTLALVLALRRTPERAALAALPCLTFLILIKNSGIFFIFCVLAVVWFWLLTAPGGVWRDRITAGGLCSAVPLASYWLWLRHVAMVFPEGASSKHAVSLSGYEAIFGGKSAEDIAQFNRLFWQHLAPGSGTGDGRRLLLVLGLAALTAAVLWVSGPHTMHKNLLPLAACLLGEAGWLVCLWGTYTLSMNTSEMLVLASFERYHTTMLQFLFAAVGMLLLIRLGESERVRAFGLRTACAAAALALAVVFLPVGQHGAQALYSRTPWRDPYGTQQPVLGLKQQYGLTDGSRYLFYTRHSGIDTWSLGYVARYVLNTNTADFWQFEEEWFSIDELYANYDYLVVLHRDGEIEQFLAENGYDPAADCVHLLRS